MLPGTGCRRARLHPTRRDQHVKKDACARRKDSYRGKYNVLAGMNEFLGDILAVKSARCPRAARCRKPCGAPRVQSHVVPVNTLSPSTPRFLSTK